MGQRWDQIPSEAQNDACDFCLMCASGVSGHVKHLDVELHHDSFANSSFDQHTFTIACLISEFIYLYGPKFLEWYPRPVLAYSLG